MVKARSLFLKVIWLVKRRVTDGRLILFDIPEYHRTWWRSLEYISVNRNWEVCKVRRSVETSKEKGFSRWRQSQDVSRSTSCRSVLWRKGEGYIYSPAAVDRFWKVYCATLHFDDTSSPWQQPFTYVRNPRPEIRVLWLSVSYMSSSRILESSAFGVNSTKSRIEYRIQAQKQSLRYYICILCILQRNKYFS